MHWSFSAKPEILGGPPPTALSPAVTFQLALGLLLFALLWEGICNFCGSIAHAVSQPDNTFLPSRVKTRRKAREKAGLFHESLLIQGSPSAPDKSVLGK